MCAAAQASPLTDDHWATIFVTTSSVGFADAKPVQ
jgi:hypothetical protein